MRSPRLEKLKIHVYGNRKRIGSPQDTFEVMFNPESYALEYQNVYQSYQGINTSGRKAMYSLSKPSNLSLELLLDDSGVVPVSGIAGAVLTGSALVKKIAGSQDIYQQVQRFLQLTTYMDGEIHEPKFLKLEWGDLIFNCRLASVKVSYTLFNRGGQPTRAKLDTEFVGDIEDSKRLKQEDKSSPDLTHVRVVKADDTLPLLADRIYGDAAYYMQLAKANKLNNFRKLRAGSAVHFPPIKSGETPSQD
jgi:LysM repeat protein